MKNKILLIPLALLLAMSLVAIGCAAPAPAPPVVEYPTKLVRVVCSSAPGGGSDILTRWITKVGPKHFGQDMIVVTKAGGQGATCMAFVRERPADGYTICDFTCSNLIATATGVLPFNPAVDILPVVRVEMDPYTVAVLPDSPWNTLDELLAYIREHPGELTAGGYGTASSESLGWLKLLKAAGDLKTKWVPYDSSGEARTACLGGHIDIAPLNISETAEYHRAGRLKILAVCTPERMEIVPDVPTYKELGYDVEASHWRGIFTHPDTPQEVVTKLRELLKETIHDPEFLQHLADCGMEPADTFASSAEFSEWVANEVEAYKVILKEIGAIK